MRCAWFLESTLLGLVERKLSEIPISLRLIRITPTETYRVASTFLFGTSRSGRFNRNHQSVAALEEEVQWLPIGARVQTTDWRLKTRSF